MLQLAFLMQKLIKVRREQLLFSSLGSCYWFLKIPKSARRGFWGGPAEGDRKGQCTQKLLKTVIFEGTLLRIVFQKCASHRERGAHV